MAGTFTCYECNKEIIPGTGRAVSFNGEMSDLRMVHNWCIKNVMQKNDDRMILDKQVRIAALNASVASLGSNCTRRRIVLRAQEFEDYLNGEVLDRFEGEDSGDE